MYVVLGKISAIEQFELTPIKILMAKLPVHIQKMCEGSGIYRKGAEGRTALGGNQEEAAKWGDLTNWNF